MAVSFGIIILKLTRRLRDDAPHVVEVEGKAGSNQCDWSLSGCVNAG